MKRYVKVFFISLGLSLVVAALVSFAAFDHNPQGEFVDRDTGKVNVQNTLGIFVSWFLVTWIVFGIIGSAITFLAGIVSKAIKDV
jgi:hypothetical protein